MSFLENLIKARSHIVFVISLGCGLALVMSLEKIDDKTVSAHTNQAKNIPQLSQDASLMDIFEEITPLPLAIVGSSSTADIAYGKTAWRYFENNTHLKTGLVNSVDKYPSTTMWETGSYFVAVISANLLGIIDTDEAKARIDLALETLIEIRLFDDVLPNKAYNVTNGELVDYANNPVDRGLGWSALDIARMVGTLGQVGHAYPTLAKKVSVLMNKWDLSLMVENGQLVGGNVINDTLRHDQEGRVGYEQYAAKAMMLFGFDMYRAYQAEDMMMIKVVENHPIPVDNRLHRNITPAFTLSEPYLFDGLEFGFDARSIRFATSIYKAQEARYHNTGVLTAVSESHLDVAPYFIYSSVWGGGAPWAVMSFGGERLDSKRTVTTKAAFAWNALFGTDYTRKLVAAVGPLGDPERGFPEGIFEIDGSTNSSLTTNTNAVVLAALAFRAHGPLIRADH